MSEPIITFLGTGSMNGSIMSGLLAGGTAPERVRATTRSAASARKLKESLPEDQRDVTVYSGEDNESANLDAVKDADVVLLGVKPKGILTWPQRSRTPSLTMHWSFRWLRALIWRCWKASFAQGSRSSGPCPTLRLVSVAA